MKELENIKTSRNKDDDTKYRARKILHLMDDRSDMYDVRFADAKVTTLLWDINLEETPDNIICACASLTPDVEFITNDMACKAIARSFFNLNVSSVNIDADEYTGFAEVFLNESEQAYLYEHLNENIYGLLINQYLIVKNSDADLIDTFVWNGSKHESVKFSSIKSAQFGTVKPYNGDVYQMCVMNSLSKNQLTMIKGKAGTGKSYLAISYLISLLEKHKIDKIIIFCNTVATANSAKLGYYPGTKDEKLRESSVGNILNSKLGSAFAVEQMIAQEKIVLLPMSDIRGYDTSGLRAGIYITEAENMDISLMKLALQRIGSDSVCVIDGDYKAQVDLPQYSGANNGMRRMSEVFRGQDFYGEVELQNIYRSKIAEIAELM